MTDKMTSINPAILVWARQMSGTTIEEAYAKFGRERLAAWESGAEYPTYLQLKSLCDYYRKPVAICFFPEPPVVKNIPSSCRTLPNQLHSLFSRNLVKSIDDARVMQLNLYELHEGVNPAGGAFNNMVFDVSDIHRTAEQLRQLLQAPLAEQKRIVRLEDALEYWRDKFYAIGIYVFKDAFKDNAVSGLCLYDDVFPIISINNSFAVSRQIFTLFHEAYHLIAKTSGIDIFDDADLRRYGVGADARVERFCNQFAGAFLVPDDDFRIASAKRAPTDANVSALASTYSVSREVILRKYFDAGRITQADYEERSAGYTKDYFRHKNSGEKSSGNYYNTQAAYKGRHYLELAFGSYYSNKISLVQLSQYMNMKISSVQSFAAKKGWGSL